MTDVYKGTPRQTIYGQRSVKRPTRMSTPSWYAENLGSTIRALPLINYRIHGFAKLVIQLLQLPKNPVKYPFAKLGSSHLATLSQRRMKQFGGFRWASSQEPSRLTSSWKVLLLRQILSEASAKTFTRSTKTSLVSIGRTTRQNVWRNSERAFTCLAQRTKLALLEMPLLLPFQAKAGPLRCSH